jgi:FkbM family methyltransferase
MPDVQGYWFPDGLVDNNITLAHGKGVWYEPELLEDSRQFIKPGDLVVDIGANVGNHAVYWAGVCEAKVVAFEPDPELRRLMALAVLKNNLGMRVLVRGEALASCRCQLREVPHPVRPEHSPGNRTFVVDPDGPVDAHALDVALDFLGVVYKIDVEGMEEEVVRGALRHLVDARAVYIEASAPERLDQLLAPLVRTKQFGGRRAAAVYRWERN